MSKASLFLPCLVIGVAITRARVRVVHAADVAEVLLAVSDPWTVAMVKVAWA